MQIGNDSAGFARLLTAIAEVVPGPRVAVCIEGSKTAREIRRCLKRYIARELYRQLTRSMNLPAGPSHT